MLSASQRTGPTPSLWPLLIPDRARRKGDPAAYVPREAILSALHRATDIVDAVDNVCVYCACTGAITVPMESFRAHACEALNPETNAAAW